jgi:hypothetical protein
MEVTYFSRWLWAEGRGLDPLSEKRLASIDRKGSTYVAHLPEERLALTLRPESRFVSLGFLAPTGERLGGIALIVGPPQRIESIDVWQHQEEIVRLQGGDGDRLTVSTAPFSDPTVFSVRNVPDIAFPSIGDYDAIAELPRNPWDYIDLPTGFTPPQPAP